MSDDISKPLEEKCIWHKSQSIPRTNPAYEDCRTKCDGYNARCIIYMSNKEYMKNIEHLGGETCGNN